MSKRFHTKPHQQDPAAGMPPAKGSRKKGKPNVAIDPALAAAPRAVFGSPEETSAAPEDSACHEVPATVSSLQSPDAPANPATAATAAALEDRKMEQTFTLNRNTTPRKTDRLVIFDGGHLHSVQFLRSAFGETIPDSITITGEFAEPKPERVPREKETPEQRKARLAAMPKLTLEEKVAKAERRAQELRDKLARKAAGAAGAEAPAAG